MGKKLVLSIMVSSLFSCAYYASQIVIDAKDDSIIGEWGISRISIGACNMCPDMSFNEKGEGKIYTDELVERFHWNRISSDTLNIFITSEDVNTFFGGRFLKPDAYLLKRTIRYHEGKEFEQLEILDLQEHDPIVTIMRRKREISSK